VASVDFSLALGAAVVHLAEDGFLAYPTETVWGLGACADRPRAIERLMRWKGRAGDAPLAVLVVSAESAEGLGCRFDATARRLMGEHWPGPLMLVVPCSAQLAPGVARTDGALGLRCSPHPVTRALAEAVEAAGLGPLTSTSLNRSGDPPALDAEAARAAVGAPGSRAGADPLADPLWLEGLLGSPDHDAGGSAPSSVVDCTGEEPVILRVGAIDRDTLEQSWRDGGDRVATRSTH
jgi:tRNA threonylcarbamoyl adenosine modification protein (Sua5/YciO/YrdC/YwlC family)